MEKGEKSVKVDRKLDKRVVQVKILDQTFSFATDAAPERVQKIADTLNQSIKDILSKSRTIAPHTAAVLVALNMTEKYLALAEKQTVLKSRISEKSKKILGLLDKANPA